MKEYVLPEFGDHDMQLLHDRSNRIFNYLKKTQPEKEVSLDEAIVLGIFALFNPDNLPMSEENIQTLFSAYHTWLEKKVTAAN